MPAQAKETLRGLPGVAVVIEPLHPTTERDGLKRSQLLAEVEQQLKDAGIRVLTQEEWKATPGAPYLYVNVATLKKSYGLYAYAWRNIEASVQVLNLADVDWRQTQFATNSCVAREVGVDVRCPVGGGGEGVGDINFVPGYPITLCGGLTFFF